MANLDHTCICFHKNKLMKTIYDCDTEEFINEFGSPDFKFTNEKYYLPFKITRDGEYIFSKEEYKQVVIMPCDFTWLPWKMTKRKWHKLNKKFERYLHDTNKRPHAFDEYIELYDDGKIFIVVYHTPNYNVTIYSGKTPDDVYAIVGGYGHYKNPFTHFYNRGYGSQVERKMCKECFDWIFENVLETIETHLNFYEYLDDPTSKYKLDVKAIREAFGYKSYWDMTNTERNHIRQMVDYDDNLIEY